MSDSSPGHPRHRAARDGVDLEDLIGAVGAIRRRIAAGETVAIEALARDLAGALAFAAAAHPIPVTAMRRQLMALQDEIELLVEATEHERAATGRRLGELTARGRADRAYGGRG